VNHLKLENQSKLCPVLNNQLSQNELINFMISVARQKIRQSNNCLNSSSAAI